MAFKEVLDLGCDVSIALGGINKKTGKANPKTAEGYFLGSRTVASPKSKTGTAKLHIFDTEKGKLGVWGKTDLDIKISGVAPGAMTRVTFTGMKETKNNPMYVYKVEVDSDNTIDVSGLDTTSAGTSESYSEEESDASVANLPEDDTPAEEAPLDEAPPARAVPPRQPAKSPTAARQAELQAMVTRTRTAVRT